MYACIHVFETNLDINGLDSDQGFSVAWSNILQLQLCYALPVTSDPNLPMALLLDGDHTIPN